MQKDDKQPRDYLTAEQIQAVRDWYRHDFVINEILAQAWDREFAFSGYYLRDGFSFHKRGLMVTGKDYAKHFFWNREYVVTDAFTSFCAYDGAAMIGMSEKEKKEHFAFTDPVRARLAFDIDFPSCDNEVYRIGRAWEETVSLVDYLWKRFDYDISVVFSGGKGFHVETGVEGDYHMLEEYREIAMLLKKKFLNIDAAIYTARREWRVPYSIHGKHFLVCLPLDKKHLELFGSDVEKAMAHCEPNYVVDNIKLHKRGMVTI